VQVCVTHAGAPHCTRRLHAPSGCGCHVMRRGQKSWLRGWSCCFQRSVTWYLVNLRFRYLGSLGLCFNVLTHVFHSLPLLQISPSLPCSAAQLSVSISCSDSDEVFDDSSGSATNLTCNMRYKLHHSTFFSVKLQWLHLAKRPLAIFLFAIWWWVLQLLPIQTSWSWELLYYDSNLRRFFFILSMNIYIMQYKCSWEIAVILQPLAKPALVVLGVACPAICHIFLVSILFHLKTSSAFPLLMLLCLCSMVTLILMNASGVIVKYFCCLWWWVTLLSGQRCCYAPTCPLCFKSLLLVMWGIEYIFFLNLYKLYKL